jgi:hypothetical protein
MKDVNYAHEVLIWPPYINTYLSLLMAMPKMVPLTLMHSLV